MPVFIQFPGINKKLIKRLFEFTVNAQYLCAMEYTEKQLHILRVAKQLFAEQGYTATSVRNIADAAKVNVSMISYYFGGKDGLLKAIVESHADLLSIELEKIMVDAATTPEEKVSILCSEIVDKFWDNRVMYRILVREAHFQENPELLKIVESIRNNRFMQFSHIIHEGQEKGLFRRNVNVALMHASVIGLMKQVYFANDYYYELLKIQEGPNRDEQLLDAVKDYLKSIFNYILHERSH